MKKLFLFSLFFCLAFSLSACKKQSPYNRTSDKQDYEYILRTHVFAACQNLGKPYALYSLAKLNQRPAKDDPHYKITFVNGPCKGKTVWTTEVITKTAPVGKEDIPRGTLLLRNYDNPRTPFDKEHLDRWHIGVVTNNTRVSQGIIDLEFPRDANDFFPAREGVFLHNARYIIAPEVKDIRTFL